MKKLELPALPYAYDALEPVISKKIMELHHDKHHLAYVNGANAAMEKIEKARKGELQVDYKAVLRDYSFHMNGHVMHDIFWKNMKPAQENNHPGGKIADALNMEFGSFDVFKKEFGDVAKGVEGSGWAVLAKNDNNEPYVMGVEKHNLLHVAGHKVLLAIDVWEHAYYLDYLNNRGAYVDGFWKIINWDDVERRFSR